MQSKNSVTMWPIILAILLTSSATMLSAGTVHKITMTVKEIKHNYDNKGEQSKFAWTFDGQIPGPLVRVTEGDSIEFTLVNPKGNRNSHSMDFHAARVDIMTAFKQIAPGETRKYTFSADYPGVFLYHCGADQMIQHIAMGMFGAIIVDPKNAKDLPKADREYLLVQSEIYDMKSKSGHLENTMNNKWKHVVFNGTPFKYDPVHDPMAKSILEAAPGERVRIYLVNAGPNEPSYFHAIGGIWDRVWVSGNPANEMQGLQTFTVGPGDAAIFDLVSDKAGYNALVTHSMRAAHSGAIAIIKFSDSADPDAGRGLNVLIR